MNDYTKGILTGASLILCFFMFVGAKSQSDNLGDITVNSIMVLNDGTGGGGTIRTFNPEGKETAYLGGSENGNGILEIINADGKKTVYLGTGEDGSGVLTTNNADGKRTAYLGTSEGGGGVLKAYNKHEVMVGYFGTGNNGKNIIEDGMAILFDRYGDIGWGADGKK